jgi:phosphate-selective porin OprO and OprP
MRAKVILAEGARKLAEAWRGRFVRRHSGYTHARVSFPGRYAVAAVVTALSVASGVLQAQAPPTTPSVTVGGVMQADYELVTAGDQTRDRAFFRRLLLMVQVVATKDWAGQIQFDAAPAVSGERLVVRDAYLRYLGWTDRGLTVTMGNQKMPFSRAALVSASRRGLIERGAPGERPFGAPGRALAVQIEGRHRDQRVQWAAAVASALHSPDVAEIRIDGLAEARETWNEGVLGSGRVEWHPLGAMLRDQGDFLRSRLRVAVGGGAYTWHNDGDRNLFTTNGIAAPGLFADADRARGFEVSGGLRGHGFSLDASWQRIDAHTIDASVTAGIYSEGEAVFHVTGVEAGYMLVAGKLELLGGFDTIDVASRAAVTTRPAFGANWYVNQHRLKFQFMQRETFNLLGVRGARSHATVIQTQLAF